MVISSEISSAIQLGQDRALYVMIQKQLSKFLRLPQYFRDALGWAFSCRGGVGAKICGAGQQSV